MAKDFKDYNIDQPLLLPVDLREWVNEDHFARFIDDIINQMDLSLILDHYKKKCSRGPKAYDPRMMLKLYFYGYSVGITSSRKIEVATYENVAFRFLSGDQHPDHDTIANFRKIHTNAISSLFLQVLKIAMKMNLIGNEHISFDSTKIKAYATKSKARKKEDLERLEKEIKNEIDQFLSTCSEIDEIEDERFGESNNGYTLPDELKDAQKRQEKIRKAIEAIEEEGRVKLAERKQQKEEWSQEDSQYMEENNTKFEKRSPHIPKGGAQELEPKSRTSVEEPDAKIMSDRQSGGFILGYNCHAVVDDKNRIIISTNLTNHNHDKGVLRNLVSSSLSRLESSPPIVTADPGYYSERDNVWMESQKIDPYIPPPKNAKGKRLIKTGGKQMTHTEYMRKKLITRSGKNIYRSRKTVVEPVFGRIKHHRGFRQFSLKGIDRVSKEWELICLTENLLRMHAAKHK